MGSASPLLLGKPRFPDTHDGPQGPGDQWLALVRQHGQAGAAAQVRGPFAVALTLDDGSSFLAVDRFACHSLCYRVDGTTLQVGERADQVARPGGALDLRALNDYLYHHAIPSPHTVFAGVSRLPPGHYGHFKDGRLTVAPYWVPEFQEPAEGDFNGLAEEFRALLRQAVRRALDGTKPACFLSGGTDSSTVAGLMAELSGERVSTFSIGFEAEGYDEMAFARIAARHFGCDHYEHYVTPADLVRDIPQVAATIEQPFGNSSLLPAMHCAQRAVAEGVGALLAGDGGDELFGGNSRYASEAVFRPYARLPTWLRKGLIEPVVNARIAEHLPVVRRGKGYVRRANTPMPARLQAFNLLQRLGPDDVLEPGFRSAFDLPALQKEQQQAWDSARCREDLNRHLAFDWRYTLAESDLPKVNMATALAGAGVAYPMLDDDLLAFSMRLPVHYKVNRQKLRWFFKEALRDFLPQEILVKKKQGFGLPFGVWTVRNDPLRRLATDAIDSLSARRVVRPAFARALMQQHLPAHPHYYGTMVWILMMLEHWLRGKAPDFRV